jgi:6,7-dimethyl-8-ribityllumazine synthase
MAGPLKSSLTSKSKSSISKKRVAIVVAAWNEEITEAMFESALDTLRAHGLKKENIIRKSVPGSFELTLGALWMAEKKDIDAVICLGCIIQGETAHFDYICQAVAYGITEVGIKTKKPIGFGVLTTLDKKQALERAGGKAALTVIEMLGFN